MMQRARYMFECMTRGERIALAVFAAAMLAWTVFVTASQQAGFERHKAEMESRPEVVVLMTDKGPMTVDKSDYDAANAAWRESHPEDYAVLDGGGEPDEARR